MVSNIILIAFSLLTPVSGIQDPNMIQDLNQEIVLLESALADLRADSDRNYQIQTELFQSALQSVNTSISGVQFYLAAVGVVVGIFSALLVIGGIFISRQVSRTKKDADQSLKTCKKIVEEASKLKDDIDTNIDTLYNRLRLAELDYLLDRLKRVPEDIINLFTRLASQDIPQDRYPKFKTAYLSHPEPFQNPHVNFNYRILFYQHFPNQALFDPEIGAELERNYGLIVDAAFNNEITTSSIAFFLKRPD